MRETVVVAGSLAQRPHAGGHAWVFLQYLLGFRRLGYDVLFLDRLEPGMCVDASGAPSAVDASTNLASLADVMADAGLGSCWSVLLDGHETRGLERPAVLERVRRSVLLLDVMGFLGDEELLAAAPCRVLLDIDPGFGQMWRELGLHDLFSDHDRYVTVGENVGQPGCTIPTGGIDWVTTRPPVVLDAWPAVPLPATTRFTSVASWRGPFAPVDYDGSTYGLRVHELRRFLALPAATGLAFELALDIHPAEVDDLRRLHDTGWRLVDPQAVAGTPAAYRDYVQGSTAELMVAKNMYVRSGSGWFSDRSACYLASGRPVLAQDTGLGPHYPTGEGLVTFRTPEEAEAGAAEIAAEPARHSRAARAVAEEMFGSDRVLSTLLDRVGAA